jgi:predicted lipoprotein with Yx(FWY)xxD motif
MKRFILFGVSAVVLAACGQAVNAGTPTPTPSKSAAAVHTATNATLGTFLTTGNGRTLYYFTAEHDAQITCIGACTQTWIPYKSNSGLLTTDVTLPGTLTTVPRPDGGRQVTYSDWPLYTFIGDKAAGDTNGDGILGKWFVATTSLMENLPTPTPAPTPEPTAAPTHVATPAPTMHPTPLPTRRPTPPPTPMPTSCIPGSNGGDHDGDNNGGPSDGDGCQ